MASWISVYKPALYSSYISKDMVRRERAAALRGCAVQLDASREVVASANIVQSENRHSDVLRKLRKKMVWERQKRESKLRLDQLGAAVPEGVPHVAVDADGNVVQFKPFEVTKATTDLLEEVAAINCSESKGMMHGSWEGSVWDFATGHKEELARGKDNSFRSPLTAWREDGKPLKYKRPLTAVEKQRFTTIRNDGEPPRSSTPPMRASEAADTHWSSHLLHSIQQLEESLSISQLEKLNGDKKKNESLFAPRLFWLPSTQTAAPEPPPPPLFVPPLSVSSVLATMPRKSNKDNNNNTTRDEQQTTLASRDSAKAEQIEQSEENNVEQQAEHSPRSSSSHRNSSPPSSGRPFGARGLSTASASPSAAPRRNMKSPLAGEAKRQVQNVENSIMMVTNPRRPKTVPVPPPLPTSYIRQLEEAQAEKQKEGENVTTIREGEEEAASSQEQQQHLLAHAIEVRMEQVDEENEEEMKEQRNEDNTDDDLLYANAIIHEDDGEGTESGTENELEKIKVGKVGERRLVHFSASGDRKRAPVSARGVSPSYQSVENRPWTAPHPPSHPPSRPFSATIPATSRPSSSTSRPTSATTAKKTPRTANQDNSRNERKHSSVSTQDNFDDYFHTSPVRISTRNTPRSSSSFNNRPQSAPAPSSSSSSSSSLFARKPQPPSSTPSFSRSSTTPRRALSASVTPSSSKKSLNRSEDFSADDEEEGSGRKGIVGKIDFDRLFSSEWKGGGGSGAGVSWRKTGKTVGPKWIRWGEMLEEEEEEKKKQERHQRRTLDISGTRIGWR